MKKEAWPHGLCECRDGCACEQDPGPAVMKISRDGKELRVCTRCELSTDKPVRVLVTKDDPVLPLMIYDTLGLYLLGDKMDEQNKMDEQIKMRTN